MADKKPQRFRRRLCIVHSLSRMAQRSEFAASLGRKFLAMRQEKLRRELLEQRVLSWV